MRVFDLFSKRRDEEENSGQEDVFQYDEVPSPLRSQVKRIVGEALGAEKHYTHYSSEANGLYKIIESIYCREVGIDDLGGKNSYLNVRNAIDIGSTDRFLDILELLCRLIDSEIREFPPYELSKWGIVLGADDAIAEVNYRLRKAGLGYQYESGKLIRQDSVYLHEEAVKPALSLLSKSGFAGVQEEFLRAHQAYRDGDHEEAITEAAKSFESMMKAICEKRGWDVPGGARASDLLKALRRNNFIPKYLEASFDQLVATLSSGLPKVRNDSAAHGQGAKRRKTPHYVAAYALNLAASKIVLLGEIDSDLS